MLHKPNFSSDYVLLDMHNILLYVMYTRRSFFLLIVMNNIRTRQWQRFQAENTVNHKRLQFNYKKVVFYLCTRDTRCDWNVIYNKCEWLPLMGSDSRETFAFFLFIPKCILEREDVWQPIWVNNKCTNVKSHTRNTHYWCPQIISQGN